MITIRSIMDIQKARLPPHLLDPVMKYMQAILKAHGTSYNPDNDGFLAVITPTDTDDSLGRRLGRKWQEGGFEGASYDKADRCYITMILRNNQFAISIIIPDESWLDPLIRNRMLREMSGEGGDSNQ